MTILDFSGIAMAALFSQGSRLEEDLLRHMILNSIRMYNVKFRKAYGELVIACDGGSWRRAVFPEYKASRRKSKDENKSGIDWTEFYRIINLIRDELTENFHYRVVQVSGAEADDVIATLVKSTQVDFGVSEPVMIVSADHDFIQLQKYSNVKQFSPLKKKAVTDPKPHRYLGEHILRGDVGDGVPNVLSPDNCFVEGQRQTPMSTKKIEAWIHTGDIGLAMSQLGGDAHRNFKRNQLVIDFDFIPEDVSTQIMEAYAGAVQSPKAKIFPYLVSHRCNQLVSSCADFF